MAKKAAVETAAPAEATAPAEQPAAPAEAEGKKISKMAAVREALAAKVEDPSDIVDYVRKKHGLEMTNAHVSAYKSSILKKQGQTPGKRGRKPNAERQAAPQPVAKLAPGRGLAETMEALRDIVREYGAGEVKKLVDLFGHESNG